VNESKVDFYVVYWTMLSFCCLCRSDCVIAVLLQGLRCKTYHSFTSL